MPVNRSKRRLRALVDRVVGGGRIVSRDVATVSLVPRFAIDVRRSTWHGADFLEVRVRTPGMAGWSAWLATDAAAARLHAAGFVDHAIAVMGGFYLEGVRNV